MEPKIFLLNHDLAKVWIAFDDQKNIDYCYGGTRTVDPDVNDEEVEKIIKRLSIYESGLKNCLINQAIKQNYLENLENSLPKGFLNSRVGGARCIIRPKNESIAAIMKDPKNEQFESIVSEIFKMIGTFLNKFEGKIKLTPDFGRFAGLADILNKFTPNVLGIKCENGGCGGKASYTSTGIIQAVKTIGFEQDKTIPVTLIGSAGACGTGVLDYLIKEKFTDIAVCDLVYDDPDNKEPVPDNTLHLKSKFGSFTDECLSRGGLIIATTVGHELINSNRNLIPAGSTLLLAHNEALPEDEEGIELVEKIQKNNVMVLPGQMLTFGGALTSRIEWFWRQSNKGINFHKELAHDVVRKTTDFLIQDIVKISKNKNQNSYQTILTDFDYISTMKKHKELVLSTN